MYKEKNLNCPICDYNNPNIVPIEPLKDIYKIECPRCGDFKASGLITYYHHDNSFWWSKRHILSSIIKEHYIKNEDITINDKQIQSLLVIYPIPKFPKEKADRLLVNLSYIHPNLGEKNKIIFEHSYSLGFCENNQELDYLLRHLQKLSLLSYDTKMGSIEITIKGWEYIDNIVNKNPKTTDTQPIGYLKNFRDMPNDAFDKELKKKIQSLLNQEEFDSAIRKSFVILRSRMMNKFEIKEDIDGADLVNKIFGKKGVIVGFISDNERQAMRNLLDGAYGMFRNKYGHEDVEPLMQETVAVISLINWSLIRMDEISL